MRSISIGEKSDLVRVSKPGGGGVQGGVVKATWRTWYLQEAHRLDE
jgi:hypothetical protein